MPFKKSDKYIALEKLILMQPKKLDNFLIDDTKIISQKTRNRLIKENVLHQITGNFKKEKSVIGDYATNYIPCYGSSSSSGWGSFPSSDSASIGGVGTEGAIQG